MSLDDFKELAMVKWLSINAKDFATAKSSLR